MWIRMPRYAEREGSKNSPEIRQDDTAEIIYERKGRTGGNKLTVAL